MSETKISAKVCRELEQIGALTLSITPDQRGRVGWPDKFIAHAKWSGFVEFKIGERSTTRFQKHIIYELKRRHVQALVVRVLADGVFKIEDENGRQLYMAIGVAELLERLSCLVGN